MATSIKNDQKYVEPVTPRYTANRNMYLTCIKKKKENIYKNENIFHHSPQVEETPMSIEKKYIGVDRPI